MCRAVQDNDTQSAEGWKKIVDAPYKRDAFSVVSDEYQIFKGLQFMKRGSSDTFKKFGVSICGAGI